MNPSSAVSEASAGSAWLCCRVAGLLLALPLAQVREIVRQPPLQPLPLTPPWLRGLCGVRGQPLLALDLGLLLGLGRSSGSRHEALLVLDGAVVSEAGAEAAAGALPAGVALWVERVHEIVTADTASSEVVPDFGIALPPRLVQQVLRWRDQRVLGLALAQVLDVNALAEDIEQHARQCCAGPLVAR